MAKNQQYQKKRYRSSNTSGELVIGWVSSGMCNVAICSFFGWSWALLAVTLSVIAIAGLATSLKARAWKSRVEESFFLPAAMSRIMATSLAGSMAVYTTGGPLAKLIGVIVFSAVMGYTLGVEAIRHWPEDPTKGELCSKSIFN